jgi:hypothetical protein
VSLERGPGDTDPIAGGRIESIDEHRAIRRATAARPLAHGTLACPECDAPVVLPRGTATPGEPLSCGFCAHAARVRDFLSLAPPTRPTRVVVRVREPALVRR